MSAFPTTMTQLLFVGTAKFNFAHVVSDLRALLSDDDDGPALVIWDCDDAVTFQNDAVQLVVGCGDALSALGSQHLTFAMTSRRLSDAKMHQLADILRHEMVKRYRPESVTTAQCGLWPDVGLLDIMAQEMMAARMRDSTFSRPARLSKIVEEADVESCMARIPGYSGRSDVPQIKPRTKVRPQFFELPPDANDEDEVEVEESLALRISTQLFNLTLAVVWLPLGVFLLARSVLQGGDLRLSAQSMAIAGLFSCGIDLQTLLNVPQTLGI